MKKIIILLLVLTFFSCKQEKYTTQSLFLENLRESSSFYEEEIKMISASIKVGYQDYSVKSTKLDALDSITKRLDVFLNDIKSKDKQEKIMLQEKFVKDINNIDSEYKLNSFFVEKLEVLDNETLYYYLKFELCKNQFENYKIHLKNLPIYCGYTKLSDKQAELIKIIENSNIK